MRLLRAVAIGWLLAWTTSPAVAQHPFITVASTTSTEHKIADGKAKFVARGDDSGTGKAEFRFWKEAGLDPKQSA
jgi:hypothetical protein